MSFADKAYDEVLKQFKEEKKEFVLCEEECNTGKYKTVIVDYKIAEYEDSAFPEEILEENSVPQIINALKKYYIEHYEISDNLRTLCVSDCINSYGIKTLDYYKHSKGVPCYETATPSETKEEDLKKLDKALQDYLKAPEKTVSDFVIKKQNELNLKSSEVYKPVFMSKQNYSKIISNYTKHPKFEACIQLAFGLKLNLDETSELLRRAGNAFSDDIYDRVIKYFIEHQHYDIFELNKCLDKIGKKPIGNF